VISHGWGQCLSFLQCFHTVGLVTGRASGPQKPVQLIREDSLPDQVEEKTE